MAFNPFHRFRKHQKAIIAVLAIVCMIIFVFSFGPGDLFSRDWFGSRSRGEEVTSLYGRTVYAGDLQEALARRQLASQFLSFLTTQAFQETAAALRAQQKELEGIEGATGAVVRQVQMAHQQRQQFGHLFFRNQEEAWFQQARRDLETLRDQQLSATLKPAQARALSDLVSMLQFECLIHDPQRAQSEFFLGGTRKPEDLLDFLLWKHQADRLGISLTEPAILALANQTAGRDLLQGDRLENDKTVETFFRIFERRDLGGFDKPADLLEALQDELRVLLAREAVLGKEPSSLSARSLESLHPGPARPTPLDFLLYYRSQRTSLQLAVLDLPVENFRDQVTGKPGDATLQELYEKYKNDEPSPQRDRPAFKEPRRVRVEYVVGKPDLPTYLKRAAQVHQAVRGLSRLGIPMQAYPVGGGALPWAVNVALPSLFDLSLLAEYQQYLDRPEGAFTTWVEKAFEGTLHDRSLLRSGPVTALVGQLLGARLTQSSSLSVASAWFGAATIYEEAERGRVYRSFAPAVAQAFAARAGVPTYAGIGGIFAYTTLPATKIHVPDPVELEVVRTRLLEDIYGRLSAPLMQEDFKALAREIPRLRSMGEEQQRKELKAVLQKYGLEDQLHAMETAQDRYELVDAPAIKTLKEAYDRAALSDPTLPPVSQMLMRTAGVYDPIRFAADLVRFPDAWPNSSEPFLIWRAEDYPARVPPFQEARSKVETAWYRLQARQLAQRKAQEIRQQLEDLKAKQAPAVTLQNLNEESRGEVFELKDVAPLLPRKTASETFREYEPFQIPESKIAYPPANLVERLMTLERPGDSLVFTDRPQQHSYVAVLLARSEPTLEEFQDLYRRTPSLDGLWQNYFLPHVRGQYEDTFMKSLRSEAGLADDSGVARIPEAVRERLEGRTEE